MTAINSINFLALTKTYHKKHLTVVSVYEYLQVVRHSNFSFSATCLVAQSYVSEDTVCYISIDVFKRWQPWSRYNTKLLNWIIGYNGETWSLNYITFICYCYLKRSKAKDIFGNNCQAKLAKFINKKNYLNFTSIFAWLY